MSNILVLNDDPEMREAVVRVLESGGHSPWIAAEGRAALAELKAGTFDMVVAALMMREPDGLEVIAAARSSRSPVKILAIAGGRFGSHPESAAPEWTNTLGVDRVLHMPFRTTELLEAVAELSGEQLKLPATQFGPQVLHGKEASREG